MKDTSPESRLADFIARYPPEIGALAHSALTKMRARLPGAVEMVYDNYNARVVGFGLTERPADAIFSITLYPRWVNLFFLQGANLPDPKKLLKGDVSKVRRILFENAATLDQPAVRALIEHALKSHARPVDGKAAGRLIIKSVSAKRRPRRPA